MFRLDTGGNFIKLKTHDNNDIFWNYFVTSMYINNDDFEKIMFWAPFNLKLWIHKVSFTLYFIIFQNLFNILENFLRMENIEEIFSDLWRTEWIIWMKPEKWSPQNRLVTSLRRRYQLVFSSCSPDTKMIVDVHVKHLFLRTFSRLICLAQKSRVDIILNLKPTINYCFWKTT